MGSGKTTVGKLLSSYLKYSFIDTDQLIEKQQSMTVDEIFHKKGELFFRKLERKIIVDLPAQKTVIATGGGLPVFNNNWSKLNNLGFSFYLKTNEASIIKRVSTQLGRPLFSNKNGHISSIISERETVYNRASYIVNTNDKSPEDVMNSIVKLIL
jgi:shikimate kinase